MKLKIEILSDTLISSNDKPLSIYDNDIVYDEIGLPYIPAKRIKGILKESALEIVEMYNLSGKKDFSESFDLLFGKQGYRISSLSLDNLYVEDYEKTKQIIQLKMKGNPNFFNKENIINSYANVRYQTQIDDTGVAKENSLRSSRVLRKGLAFEGFMSIENSADDAKDLLDLAVLNMRRIGAKRNRGFGKIKASIKKED